jgi:hypothetical protein
MRRAKSYYQLNEFEYAEIDTRNVLKLLTSSDDIEHMNRLYKKINYKLYEQNQIMLEQKKKIQKYFNSSTTSNNSNGNKSQLIPSVLLDNSLANKNNKTDIANKSYDSSSNFFYGLIFIIMSMILGFIGIDAIWKMLEE